LEGLWTPDVTEWALALLEQARKPEVQPPLELRAAQPGCGGKARAGQKLPAKVKAEADAIADAFVAKLARGGINKAGKPDSDVQSPEALEAKLGRGGKAKEEPDTGAILAALLAKLAADGYDLNNFKVD
jgi:hypothetical protein